MGIDPFPPGREITSTSMLKGNGSKRFIADIEIQSNSMHDNKPSHLHRPKPWPVPSRQNSLVNLGTWGRISI